MLRSLPLLLLCASAAAQSTYSLTPITPPVPATSVHAGGIDEDGNVLLNLALGSYPYTYQIWITGPGGARQLSLLSSLQQPYATHLSDFGRTLGQMDRRPTVWNPAGQPRYLRGLSNFSVTEVLAGNSAGWLVGRAYTIGGYEGGPLEPVLWIGDQLLHLDAPWGAVRAWCSDINEHGSIVGGSAHYVSPQNFRGMGWIRDGLNPPLSIGWPAGHWGNALYALNNSGEAVGGAYLETGSSEGLRWKDGVFTAVSATNDLTKIARDGTAIGTLYNAGPYYFQPTVSIGAQAWKLQDLLDPQSGAGWDLVHAADLNDSGQIVCRAFDPLGAQSVCVLTPVQGITTPGVERRPRTAQQVAQLEPTILELRKRLDPRR